MALSKVALTFLVALMFSGDALGNRIFLDSDFSSLEGFKESTTQAMAKEIENQVLVQCRAISSFDTLEVVSERVEVRMKQYQWESQDTTCDLDLPGCSGASRPVGEPTIFRSSVITLRRTDSQKQYSYIIEVFTRWDQDLPMPQPEVQISQSDYCKFKAL